jgi:hypothetical protein
MRRLNTAERVRVDKARIERGISARDKRASGFQKNLEYFVGDQGTRDIIGENDTDITVNKIFPAIRAKLPSLMFQNPHFVISSSRSDEDEKAKDGKRFLLNHFWREADGKFAARMAIQAAHFAFGAVKVGFRPTFCTNPKEGKLKYDEEGQVIVDRLTIDGKIIPKLEQGELWKDKDGNFVFDSQNIAIPSPGMLLEKETFLIEWVPWGRFVFDPEGGNDFRKHSWVAEEWVRPTEELKQDKLYNTAKLKATEFADQTAPTDEGGWPLGVNPYEQSSDISGMDDSEAVKMDGGRTRGWTIYDFVTNEIRWIAQQGEDGESDFYLREEPMPEEMWDRGPKHGGPFAFLQFNEVPNSWLGLPDIETMKEIQDEVNLLHSKVFTHMRRADRHYLVERGFVLDNDDWDQLTKGGDMSFCEVDSLDGVAPLPVAPMDPTVEGAIGLATAAFDELAGGGEQRGVASSETATQGAIIENRAQMRDADRKTIVGEFLVTMASILMRSIQANLTQAVYAKVEDPKFGRAYQFEGTIEPYHKDGDFGITLDVQALAPRTNATYRNQVLSFLQQIFVPLVSSPVGMRFLSEELLDEMFDIFEIGNTEIAKSLAKTAKEVAGALDNQAQGGTLQSPQGEVGQATGQLNGGTPSPTSQKVTLASQRTQ